MAEPNHTDDQPTGRPVEEHPLYGWAQVRTVLDYLAHNFPASSAILKRASPYPSEFSRGTLDGFGGAEVRVVSAHHDGPAPMVLFVPGMFNTPDPASTRSKVVGLYRDCGVHVATLDLRGFGSGRRHRSTGGVAETGDVQAVARALRADERVTGLALIGESLGASVSLCAAAERPELVDAVLAWSPFADVVWAARWISTHPPEHHSFHRAYHAFQAMLRSITPEGASRFDAYLANRARRRGLSLDQLAMVASPRHVVGRMTVPTRILHARDDPVLPPLHGRVLALAAEHNTHVDVRVVRTGGHAFFDLADLEWYERVTSNFLAPLQGANA